MSQDLVTAGTTLRPTFTSPFETLASLQLCLTPALPFLVAPQADPQPGFFRGSLLSPLLSLCRRNKHGCLEGGNSPKRQPQFALLRPWACCEDSAVRTLWSWVGRRSFAVPWLFWDSSWEECGGPSCLDGLPHVLGIWWLFLGVRGPPPPKPRRAGPTSWELLVPTAGNWRAFLHGSRPSTITLLEQPCRNEHRAAALPSGRPCLT